MTKEYHVIALHVVDDFWSAAAVRVVYMHSQLDRLFSPPQIPPMLVQTGQRKADEADLRECFLRSRASTDMSASAPTTTVSTILKGQLHFAASIEVCLATKQIWTFLGIHNGGACKQSNLMKKGPAQTDPVNIRPRMNRERTFAYHLYWTLISFHAPSRGFHETRTPGWNGSHLLIEHSAHI
jgi:hypothetical protein